MEERRRSQSLWSTGEEMIGWFVHKNPHAALRILSTMQAANCKFLQRSHMMFLAVMVSSPPSFKATVTSSDAEILSAGIVQISKHLNFMTSKCFAGSTSLSGFHKSSQLNAVWHWVGSSELSEALQIFHLLTVGSADQTGEVFVYIWSEIYVYIYIYIYMYLYIYIFIIYIIYMIGIAVELARQSLAPFRTLSLLKRPSMPRTVNAACTTDCRDIRNC